MTKILIEFDEELYSKLKSKAVQDERTVSGQVRYYIRKGLTNEESRC